MARQTRKPKNRIRTLAAKATKRNREKLYQRRPKLRPSAHQKKVMEDVYWPDQIDVVRAIAAQGLTDTEMAEFLGVAPDLLESWKAYYPTFARAIDEGRTHADTEVLAALYRNAVGYDYDTEEVVRTRHGGEVVQVKKHQPGETNAQKFWLTNRARDRWNAGQTVTLTGKKGGEPIHVKQETKNDVINSILNMIRPQPDGE